MNATEYEAWKTETQNSRFHWQVDEVQLRNTGNYLIYKGGENGVFINVSQSGKASIGNYTGAIPHIGEALFTEKHSRQFGSQSEAFKALIERLGIPFLLDLTGSRAYIS